jgi:hypothetical protein
MPVDLHARQLDVSEVVMDAARVELISVPCMFKLTESRTSRSVLLYTLPTRPNPGLHVQTESRGRKLPTSSANAKIQTPELASLAIEVE